MKDQELVNALREHADWWENGDMMDPLGGLEKDLFAAADRIANQSTHILALQKEIAGLRKAVRWVHDGLYLCDPEKNTVCKKSGCKKQCFHTTFPAFADAWAETPAPQLRWIPVTERLPEVWRNDETAELVNYMIYSPDFGVDIGNYHAKAKKWLCMALPCTVTHWMPLPEPPEVEDT
mgnify:CR=1 FL=1